ncbi:hypothetical protein JCM33374_g3862 [Metschnikowia sp. JCM 33374]|nr:hypothetical protein JCM33374_g3862 [Metschnikowia sp. JCM 33374]
MHLVRIGEFTLNSDHIIAATLLFTGFELAHTVGFGFSTPTETSNIRLAVSRFIEFYGIFLMIVSAIVWLQANDTLKLYIYKLFTHCGSIRKSRSFFDVHVPNENIVSALLGESMMKYTNSVLKEDFDQKQTTEAINSAISLFIWVLGDCVTVLLFATLVVIPGVLASLW